MTSNCPFTVIFLYINKKRQVVMKHETWWYPRPGDRINIFSNSVTEDGDGGDYSDWEIGYNTTNEKSLPRN